jgi:hypothetical protein
MFLEFVAAYYLTNGALQSIVRSWRIIEAAQIDYPTYSYSSEQHIATVLWFNKVRTAMWLRASTNLESNRIILKLILLNN